MQRKSFKLGYEIFIRALKYDPKKAWECNQCPSELSKRENENDFDNFKVHIANGIQMGNSNDSKESDLENNKIFEEEVLPEVVEGIEAKERTFIKHDHEREIVKRLIK